MEVIFKSLSDSSNIWVTCESCSNIDLSFDSGLFFTSLFKIHLLIFYLLLDIVYRKTVEIEINSI